MKNDNIKYAVFDMDGTLVDSMFYWRNLSTEYLSHHGIIIDSNEILSKIKPMTVEEAAIFFINHFNLNTTPKTALNEMNDIMYKHYKHNVQLKPHITKYLDTLKVKNVNLCVASATPKHLIELCLKRFDMLKYFDFLLSCDEVGIGKHQPDVYNLAHRNFSNNFSMNISKSDIAIFEDASYAAKTAKNAGYYTIGIYDKWNASKFNKVKEICDEYYLNWKEAIR